MDDIKVSTNWDLLNDAKLKRIITYDSPERKKCDLENLTADTCVCLIKPNSSEKPQLEIKSTNLISQIDILSEGNLIEVFGFRNEYLFTVEADFIDDWEGLAVYYAKITLPGSPNCILKFTRLKDPKRLWIYNAHLIVIPSTVSSSEMLFNFGNVNKLIKNSSLQISENAERFKNFFEMYLNNSYNLSDTSKTFNSHNFSRKIFQFMLNENLNEIADSESLKHFKGNTVKSNLTGNPKVLVPGTSSKANEMSTSTEVSFSFELMKNYIDDKFYKMKEDIFKHIDKKLNEFQEEQNTKLDKIISAIENLNH